jgi:hypothetical protein
MGWMSRVRFPAGAGILHFFTASRPASLLSNEYRGLSPGDKAAGTLIFHLALVPMLKIVELYLHSPIHLRGVVVNYLTTGKNLHH